MLLRELTWLQALTFKTKDHREDVCVSISSLVSIDTSYALAQVTSLPSIISLSVTCNSQASVSCLAAMTWLKELEINYVRNCNGDEDFPLASPLTSLINLWHLSLPFSFRSVSALDHLPRLTSLHLGSFSCQPKDIRMLCTRFWKVKELSLEISFVDFPLFHDTEHLTLLSCISNFHHAFIMARGEELDNYAGYLMKCTQIRTIHVDMSSSLEDLSHGIWVSQGEHGMSKLLQLPLLERVSLKNCCNKVVPSHLLKDDFGP